MHKWAKPQRRNHRNVLAGSANGRRRISFVRNTRAQLSERFSMTRSKKVPDVAGPKNPLGTELEKGSRRCETGRSFPRGTRKKWRGRMHASSDLFYPRRGGGINFIARTSGSADDEPLGPFLHHLFHLSPPAETHSSAPLLHIHARIAHRRIGTSS